MFFVVPTPSYPREKVEGIFKRLYAFSNVLHLFSAVLIATEFSSRLQTNYSDLFTSSEVVIEKSLSVVLNNCNTTDFLHANATDNSVSVTYRFIGIAFKTIAHYTTGLIAVELFAILNGLISSANYTSGNRHLRVLGVHLPLYHILTTLSFVYAIALIIMVLSIRTWRDTYSGVIHDCEEHLRAINSTELLEVEYDEYHVFDTPLEWALGASVVQICLSLAGCVTLFFRSNDPAVVLLSESDVPWEKRNFLCTTDKAALRLHTKARETILQEAREAIGRGDRVRIVRSYALMTEEDYDAQVEAMREHFSGMDRVHEFERLCEYFGASDSNSARGDLLWRRNASPPPPPPLASRFDADGVGITDADDCRGLPMPTEFGKAYWSDLGDSFGGSGISPAEAPDAGDGDAVPDIAFPGESASGRHRRRRHRHRRHEDPPGAPGDGTNKHRSHRRNREESPVRLEAADAPSELGEANEL